MIDIVLTWPKNRSLESYLGAVRVAWDRGEWVSFHVAAKPSKLEQHPTDCRSYMVYDGKVRGWLPVVGVYNFEQGEVRDVTGPNLFFPAGVYIVREAIWHPAKEAFAMPGFRGYRYAPPEWRALSSEVGV